MKSRPRRRIDLGFEGIGISVHIKSRAIPSRALSSASAKTFPASLSPFSLYASKTERTSLRYRATEITDNLF